MQNVVRAGSGTMKSLLGAVIALALLVLPSAAAAATTRYASPTGTGSTCSAALPCTVIEALAKSESGDTVVMAGDEGSYGSLLVPLVTALQLHSGISLESAPGQPAQIYSNAPGTAIRMEGGPGQRLSDVAIHYEGDETALRGAGRIERVLALGTIVGCELSPETVLVDSVCAGQYGIYDNVASPWSLTLRNDTIYGTQTGLFTATETSLFQITAINTVIHGDLGDIHAIQTATGTVSIDLDHSNYAGVKSEGGASVTAAGSGTNQTAAPLFVNAAAGDFAELESSPTIDAGVNDAANGTLDLAGKARTLRATTICPGATDIGAYEYVTLGTPLAPCPSPPPPPPSGESKKVKIVKIGQGTPKPKSKPTISVLRAKVRKRRATFRFEATGGTGALAFECKLDRKPFRSCASPKTCKRLKPGEHEFSVRATDSRGKRSKPAKRDFRIRLPRRR